ncbi:MAG: phosphoenolpyruvate--protein phosphotransferase [Desulfurococcaceae archaeon]|nr:phosphoenolpyruvate--protein phosphotransferase [Desulfurococcaceae archaeon]
MIVAKGIPVSEGIAISRIFKYYPRAGIEIPQECKASEKEVEKLSKALEEYKKYLNELLNVVEESERDLLQAYVLIAETFVSEARELVENSNVCGELAIKQVLDKYVELMEQSSSELFALRKSDLTDIALALVELLRGGRVSGDVVGVKDRIVVAEELTPTVFFRIQRAGVKGIITATGGITSHVAILARTYGIPYVILPSLDMTSIGDDVIAIVDGFDGKVVINPSNELMEEYMKKVRILNELRDVLKKYAFEKAKTLDGYEVEVLCNIGNVEEGRVASTQGCEGIGLFRVEYLYMSSRPPAEEVLVNTFTKVANFFEGKPVVIRAPDLGADKPPPFISIREDNPLLGLRGIRFLLEYRNEVLKPFLRGFLKAYAQSKNLRLMIPMVIKPSEVYEFIDVMNDVAQELGISYVKDLELGIMVETPAAAVLIDKFAKIPQLKFVSFGTNDLTQYVLAVDRTNPRLVRMYNELEPSVLRVIVRGVNEARKHGLKVEICGELASKSIAIPILLAFGFRSLSINPRYTGAIKYIIKNTRVQQFEQLLDAILNADEPSVVEELVIKTLQGYNADSRPLLLFSKYRS